MPRGNPKKLTALRLDPELVSEVRRHSRNLTAAVEDGLRLWLRRMRRLARGKRGTTK
jgi:hypothetical protein